jgi:hypothetical protein
LSAKQKVVALSSCEAEYIAASTAATQGVWLSRLMEELLGFESEAPLLFVDNNAVISLIKNPVLHDRSKHIEIRFHYEGPEKANRGGVNGSQSKFLTGTWPISQNQSETPLF